MDERPSSSHSLIIYPDAPQTFIYPPQSARTYLPDNEDRPGSSGSIIFRPDAPRTSIYPSIPPVVNFESPSPKRCSSGSSIIVHENAPPTIIYPPRANDYRGRRPTAVMANPGVSKRKRSDETPASIERPKCQTSALVLLLQNDSLAMATDFASFRHEFELYGIDAEYITNVDLEKIIESEGPFIYGRDDVPGRQREKVLDKGHPKFYTVIEDARKLKRKTLSWVRDTVAGAGRGDHILLVIISHGTKNGSVLIGGETRTSTVEYLTSTEVKMACANLPRHTYLTILNTCCYSGSWVEIATSGMGIRVVHAATGHAKADNFKTQSGRYRGGVFVTTLLECLRRNPDGTLSQFAAEISNEVKAYREPNDLSTIPFPPQVGISDSSFWHRQVDAFIPIHPNSTLAPTVSFALQDIQATKLGDLFKAIPRRKKDDAKSIPDELFCELDTALNLAMKRGGSNGEDQVYSACSKVLAGEASVGVESKLLRTISWRERTALQAGRIARHLQTQGFLCREDITKEVDEEELTCRGKGYYQRCFSNSKLIDNVKIPPAGCFGGHFDNSLTWLSNLVGQQKPGISTTRLKSAVEDFLAEVVIAKQEAGQGDVLFEDYFNDIM
jgi:hypothetical protein